MKTTRSTLRWQVWSIISTVPFYGTLVVLTLQPQFLVGVGGKMAWSLQLYLLTIWALLALAWFFVAATRAAGHRQWIKLTAVNAALVTLPLYFLWRTFLLRAL